VSALSLPIRRLDTRSALLLAGLLVVLVLEGVAAAGSLMLAAPLVAVIVVAVAIEIPLVPTIGGVLIVRILTDAKLASPGIRSTGALNLSAAIALMFVLIAVGLMIRRRGGLTAALGCALWLAIWTAVAAKYFGASTATIREGIREVSILALGLIVYNSRGALNVGVTSRILQLAGGISALIALQQFATHSGVLIDGQIRSNGTFVHPDGAAMFFAIAAIASLWRYLDFGRRKLDLAFTVLFGGATIATFSLAGLGALLAMLIAYGSLRPGSARLRLRAFGLAALVIVAFLATPLGSERLSNESSTNLNGSRRAAENSSLAWRLYKWGALIEEWEEAPLLGRGIGSTVVKEETLGSTTEEKVPHNEYLRYLVETGIVGIAILLLGLVLLLRALAARRPPAGTPPSAEPGRDAVGALGLAVAIGCMVDALADNTFLYTTTGYAAVMIVAAVLAVPAARTMPALLRLRTA
jgi:O-antigen ligase